LQRTARDRAGENLADHLRLPIRLAKFDRNRAPPRSGCAPGSRVATWSSPPREGNLDGIICGSRLSGETNLVVFDRASPKLTGDTAPRLVDCRANLAAIITAFDLTLV
jgi:hypothetical protein